MLGSEGRGSAANELGDPRLIVTASLSKALGGAGGVVAGSAAVVEAVRRTDAFVGKTPIPAALAAGTRAALAILRAEPQRRERLDAVTQRLDEIALAAELPESVLAFPVLALPCPTGARRAAVEAALEDAELWAPFLEYPGAGGAFRFAVNAEHTSADLDRLAAVLEQLVE